MDDNKSLTMIADSPVGEIRSRLQHALGTAPPTGLDVGAAEGGQKLQWYLAHAIRYLEQERLIALPSVDELSEESHVKWGERLHKLYRSSVEFRSALADTILTMINGDGQAIEISQVMLLQWLDETGTFDGGENFETVQAWLMAHLDGIKARSGGGYASGSWYEKAKIASYIIPFCKANLAETVPPGLFYDTGFLNRLRPGLPLLVGTRPNPGVLLNASMDLEKKKAAVLRVLHIAQTARNRAEVHRKLYQAADDTPSLEAYIQDDELRISLPPGAKGKAWAASLLRRLGSMVKLTEKDDPNRKPYCGCGATPCECPF